GRAGREVGAAGRIAGVPARPAAGRRGRGAPAVRGFAVPDAARPERDAADGVWRFGAGPFRGGAGGGDPAAGAEGEPEAADVGRRVRRPERDAAGPAGAIRRGGPGRPAADDDDLAAGAAGRPGQRGAERGVAGRERDPEPAERDGVAGGGGSGCGDGADAGGDGGRCGVGADIRVRPYERKRFVPPHLVCGVLVLGSAGHKVRRYMDRERGTQMTTRAEMRAMVRNRLEDAGPDPLWSDEVLNDAIAEALRRYSTHVPRQEVAAIEVHAGDREIEVPENVNALRVARVFDDRGVLWPRWEGSGEAPPVPMGPSGGTPTWRAWGNTLLLGMPAPRTSLWRVEHLVHRDAPVDDATPLDIQPNDEDIIVALALAVALSRRAISEG